MTLAEARKKYWVETLSNDPQFRYEVFTPAGTNYGGRHSTLAQNMSEVAQVVANYDEYAAMGWDTCPADCDCKEAA